MAPDPDFSGFEDFWPFYLKEHDRKLTRFLHIFGTTIGLILVACAVLFAKWWLLLAAVLIGYGPPVAAHYLVQDKPPVGVANPRFILWSFRGDFRMCRLFFTGRLDAELRAKGIKT